MGNFYPGLEHFQSHAVYHTVTQVHQVQPFQGQPRSSTAVTVPHPPAICPRVRARRGQTTYPHSIAERTDRAAMLYEILDYVKFLRLQLRLGGASTVTQLVADIPLQSVEGDSGESQSNQHVWEKWFNAETEQE